MHCCYNNRFLSPPSVDDSPLPPPAYVAYVAVVELEPAYSVALL